MKRYVTSTFPEIRTMSTYACYRYNTRMLLDITNACYFELPDDWYIELPDGGKVSNDLLNDACNDNRNNDVVALLLFSASRRASRAALPTTQK